MGESKLKQSQELPVSKSRIKDGILTVNSISGKVIKNPGACPNLIVMERKEKDYVDLEIAAESGNRFGAALKRAVSDDADVLEIKTLNQEEATRITNEAILSLVRDGGRKTVFEALATGKRCFAFIDKLVLSMDKEKKTLSVSVMEAKTKKKPGPAEVIDLAIQAKAVSEYLDRLLPKEVKIDYNFSFIVPGKGPKVNNLNALFTKDEKGEVVLDDPSIKQEDIKDVFKSIDAKEMLNAALSLSEGSYNRKNLAKDINKSELGKRIDQTITHINKGKETNLIDGGCVSAKCKSCVAQCGKNGSKESGGARKCFAAAGIKEKPENIFNVRGLTPTATNHLLSKKKYNLDEISESDIDDLAKISAKSAKILLKEVQEHDNFISTGKRLEASIDLDLVDPVELKKMKSTEMFIAIDFEGTTNLFPMEDSKSCGGIFNNTYELTQNIIEEAHVNRKGDIKKAISWASIDPINHHKEGGKAHKNFAFTKQIADMNKELKGYQEKGEKAVLLHWGHYEKTVIKQILKKLDLFIKKAPEEMIKRESLIAGGDLKEVAKEVRSLIEDESKWLDLHLIGKHIRKPGLKGASIKNFMEDLAKNNKKEMVEMFKTFAKKEGFEWMKKIEDDYYKKAPKLDVKEKRKIIEKSVKAAEIGDGLSAARGIEKCYSILTKAGSKIKKAETLKGESKARLMSEGEKLQKEAEKILRDLSSYCKVDTLTSVIVKDKYIKPTIERAERERKEIFSAETINLGRPPNDLSIKLSKKARQDIVSLSEMKGDSSILIREGSYSIKGKMSVGHLKVEKENGILRLGYFEERELGKGKSEIKKNESIFLRKHLAKALSITSERKSQGHEM